MTRVDNDLTKMARGTPTVGSVDGYAQGDGSQHVNYVAPTDTFTSSAGALGADFAYNP